MNQKQCQNRVCGLVSGHEKNFGTQKTKKLKPRESDILPICRDASIGAIGFNFGTLGHIADEIILALCDSCFRVFGVLMPPVLPFCLVIAGRHYNSVCTTMISGDHVFSHCLHNVITCVLCNFSNKRLHFCSSRFIF